MQKMDDAQLKKEIQKLVDDFRSNYDKYKRELEANIETKFIEPLFGLLGWKISDFEKQARAQRGKRAGHADYAFKINDKIVFFLEAKRIGVPLDKEADKQVISYALSKRIPFAVSTNFKELKIFCVEQTNALKNVFRIFTDPEEYITNLSDLKFLSKESFEKEITLKKAESEGRLKKRITIDQPLLEDLMRIRSFIASDIEKTYPKKYDLNEKDDIAQRILDRLIFIRRSEDIGINPANYTLEEIKHLPDNKAHPRLKEIFKKYNSEYDGGLFAIGVDNDCDRITIDGVIIKNLVCLLYESKDGNYVYNFDWIDADVLGQVYEQYLGKILAQTKSGKARLKESQAHKKEQGIYYTPTHIVDYIVKNTVGELLQNRKANVKGMKILDPACGSGSFLIKAVDYILAKMSSKDEAKQRKIDSQGIYSFKTEILKNNIYGVDLDNKAVEITKLNLLLKAAEKGRKLPLEAEMHIRHGNSLIDDENISGLDAFKWTGDFASGSFDVVIGNPPYFNLSKEDPLKDAPFFKNLSKGIINSAALFVKRGFDLLREGGYFGFIIPKSFIYVESWKPIRKFILENTQVLQVIDVSKAFEDVKLEQVIIIFQKKKPDLNKSVKLTSLRKSQSPLENTVKQKNLLESGLFIFDKRALAIYTKMNKNVKMLGDLTDNFRGIGVQKHCVPLNEATNSFTKAIGGKQIARYLIKGNYGAFDSKILEQYKKKVALLKQPKIIAQNLVAHISDHIKIMCAYDGDGRIVLDTVNNITLKDKSYKLKYILALLNSKLISFYTYYIIYCRSIRTMHFDGEYSGRIPIKILSPSQQNEFVESVDKLINLKKKLYEQGDKKTETTAKLSNEISKLESEIDKLVYEIYNLTEEEKAIIEESSNA